MRLLNYITFVAALTFSATTLAENALPFERVKTGILPSGGFYSLYEVSCRDSSTQAIASIDTRGKWCTLYGSQLSCYRTPDQASESACTALRVTANDKTGETQTDQSQELL